MRNIFLSGVLLVFLAACAGKANQPKPSLKSEVIPVQVLPLQQGSKELTIHSSGLLSTENEARLSFKVGGIIETISVKEGDRVKKGQLLATIKSTEISAQVQQVRLGLEKAQRDFERVNNLYRDSVATLEQLQNAKTGADIAKQNLQQVLFNEQYSRIYAPADGFIVRKLGNTGELSTAGNPVIVMSAVSTSSQWILKVGLADNEWNAINPGDEATIRFDAFPGREFAAVVSRKAIAIDPVSGSFPVELTIDFEKEQPAIGIFGAATIKSSKQQSSFSIPYEALLEANGKLGYVFVTNDKKTVKKVAVRIGSIANESAYIEQGLEGYQFLVTSGSPYLTDKSNIRVVNN